MDLTKLPLTVQATIPEEYLDLLGHMNVMWYTHLFDEATFNFYETFGFGRDYHQNTGNGSFALEQHTRYLNEVRLGEQISIRTRMLGRSEKRFHFIHFMVKDAAGKLAATTEIVGVHIDLSVRRSSPLPPEIAGPLDDLIAQHSGLGWEAPVCGVMAP